MEEKNRTGVVPENYTGKVIDTVKSTECDSTEEAKQVFHQAKARLLNVNQWHRITGPGTARFILVDSVGKEASRSVKKGDYFKIDIPGPGTRAGEGYDWVNVEEVKEIRNKDTESIGIRVRPASNPNTKDNSIAHFYSEESSSNFTITREGKKVTAAIYDRNTKPNEKTSSPTDAIRDLAVGVSAVTAFSAYQWGTLAEALIRPDTNPTAETSEDQGEELRSMMGFVALSILGIGLSVYLLSKKRKA